MSIHVKNSENGYGEITQPYMKLGSDLWTPLKQVLTKTQNNIWSEVWPKKIVYTHYNYGYNMNMFNCFGSPTLPGEYIFINKGYIGGAANTGIGNVALRTGVFPAGSKLTFINEGYVSGAGGYGASFKSGTNTGDGHIHQAMVGGSGLYLEYPITIDNSLGIIQAGGGGGGATGDFAGKTRFNARGGGGAGLPGGISGHYTWTPPGGGQVGTLTAGGAAYGGWNGRGGNPGQPGGHETIRINNDYSKMTLGAPGGISIFYSGYIQPDSVGIDGSRIFGKIVPGLVGNPYVAVSGLGRDGCYGIPIRIYLALGGINPNVSGYLISGNTSYVGVSKVNNNTFDVYSKYPGEFYGLNHWDYFTIRFALSASNGSDVFDYYARVGRGYNEFNSAPPPPIDSSSCFIAGSMVLMADGTTKPIEEIVVGDVVKTAVGVSTVYQIDHPILAERPLYVFADGKCGTSGEHSMWSRQPGTDNQWWSTRDMKQWEFEALNGFGPNFDEKPTDLTAMVGEPWEFATIDGWVKTTWYRKEASPDTQLYHLLLKEGGSYFVDGYLVSSMADSGGVDWSTYKHR